MSQSVVFLKVKWQLSVWPKSSKPLL